MKFFFDNNLPPALAKALHALSEPTGHSASHLRDMFPAAIPDAEWIDALASESGWSIVTHDKLNKGLEREALRRAGLIVFFLDRGWSNHSFWDKAHNLVRWCPRIIDQSGGMRGGAAFKVPYNFSGKGQFEQVIL
ncbi:MULTISPECIES: DUF5615 family PIN-like protein [unclassified Cupriavidus]|uniref:DUF5615 family PIN-like protein n=1 Tax=unclassified Cupriavidus TaxID=2640874 RepID=UPI001C0082A1|nr:MULTISPECIES: DUF5615 family PIN-like protein [unclassified Cupriavidus]MCA3182368.1 DUF5615 family PIN-like protein [Cupriavidus sp.]MCA3190031.1 DUF5615 family PIN-like protein [Cupriavidus sp.]MCA3197482.1 DUF5615 family PIN-like protein [Cupriavidus sp.]MCA3201821.1 DUF5615 family PIN-like protein [Cupriavidus sp.]MCA3210410.1 DUF5615 family PIN-like protein [Cupriavidus sp.]